MGERVATTSTPKFRFIDLFAGIGGFHAVMKAYGGECVYAVEIDEKAAKVYEANWGEPAFGDITKDADDDLALMGVPPHDVLCAGFPCQPFSKSGAQRGMDEARGTLFFNIASIIKKHHPKVVLLENVRNLIGPRHEHEWDVIIQVLRQEGYNVSSKPAVFSPHLLPPRLGGTPQVRERVFITATLVPRDLRETLIPSDIAGKVDFRSTGPVPVATMKDKFPIKHGSSVHFQPGDKELGWDLLNGGLLDESHVIPGCDLTPSEFLWIDAWDDFEQVVRNSTNESLKGFPYWADSWRDFPEVERLVARKVFPYPKVNGEGRYEPVGEPPASFLPERVTRPQIDPSLPDWKRSHLRRNYDAFERNWREILTWAYRWGVYTDLFPASRRKLEWQAQDAKRLWDTVMHFRPSGIRAKRATYLPALVAITQTSIVGPRERRLSPKETARLQGLPDSFTFLEQPPASTYKQMGNGVAVGAVWHVFREHVRRDRDLLLRTTVGKAIIAAVAEAPDSPAETDVLSSHVPAKPRLKTATRRVQEADRR